MELIRPVSKLPCQSDNLPNHQLSDAARVAKWRVEHGNTLVGSSMQVNLVGADTETTHSSQLVGCVDYAGRELSLRTYAQNMDISVINPSARSYLKRCICYRTATSRSARLQRGQFSKIQLGSPEPEAMNDHSH